MTEPACRQALLPEWKRYCLIAVVLASVFSGQLCAGQNSWCRFRGPNGAGISGAKTIPITWTDEDYNWLVDVPGIGHSSPVIWKDRVFLTTGDPNTATRSVLCFDVSDGRELWRRDFPAEPHAQNGSSSYASSTPAVDEHGVVVSFATPEKVLVLALDLAGGDLWERDLGPFIGPNGSGTSPIIVEDLVIMNNDQDDVRLLSLISSGTENPAAPVGESSVFALERLNGRTCWKLPRKTMLASYSTPCVRRASSGNLELILVSTAHGITGVDLVKGTVHWEIGGLFKGRCVGSPVLADDLVFASDGRGVSGDFGVAVRAEKSGERDDSTLAYEMKKAVPLVPTPLVVDGLVFFWADSGVVSCVQAASGELLWRKRVGGNYYGSPVWVDGRLYCISKNGEVVVLAASPEYELLARIPLGAGSFATPAVSNGVMYLRTHSQLLSLGGIREP